MKLSLNWLESYFITKPDWDMVWHKLTMAGIEVEGIVHVAPPFSGVVVAEVVECIKHPDADKLNLCKVNAGDGELYQIICGASNVTTGVKVPCAKVGAVLPDGLHIAERKMRGLTSFGMLCSGNEIACPDGVDGLLILSSDAPIGESIRDYLGLDDQIVEFKITPNRGDCLSIYGLLREITALTGYEVQPFVEKDLIAELPDQVKVVVDATTACPNYLALTIKNINNKISLPEQILKCLNRSGLRSISAVVDITNYVMLELGQPLHAFDLTQVGSQLQVRMASSGESIKLLDGKVANLDGNTLLICNAQNQPIAIAGVMGGLASGTTVDTTSLVLESAFFTPEIIAGRAKQYGVSSDAAYRYERGVDPQLQQRALTYAAFLITHYCGGKVGVVSHVQSEQQPISSIKLDYAELNRLLGYVIPLDKVNAILSDLGFTLMNSNTDKVDVISPGYRFDIKIKQDLIEEVVRVYGYDNIVPIMPIASYTLTDANNIENTTAQVKNCLVTLGYSEIVGYAFVEDKYESLLGNSVIESVKLQNPIAGLNVMRTSLLSDLVKSLMSNLNRGHKNIKLFEIGRVFHGEDIASQPLRVAGLVYGNHLSSNWIEKDRLADFFDVKHDVNAVIANLSEINYIAVTDNDLFHSGRCAQIIHQGQSIGIIGQLHPRLSHELGLSQSPYLFELDLVSLTNNVVVKAHMISKFQKVERDLAFIMTKGIVVGNVIAAIKAAKINHLIDLKVFDVYEDIADASSAVLDIPIACKSVAIRFVFQADKTLVDDEINSSINDIVTLVTTGFSATLRQ